MRILITQRIEHVIEVDVDAHAKYYPVEFGEFLRDERVTNDPQARDEFMRETVYDFGGQEILNMAVIQEAGLQIVDTDSDNWDVDIRS